jgi:hypothetical protein
MRAITQGYGGALVVTQGYSSYTWVAPTYPISAARADSTLTATRSDSRLTARRS